jgi:3-dehydroquinate synthase
MKTINLNIKNNPYKILIGNDILSNISSFLPDVKLFLVTDDNVDNAGWCNYFPNLEKIVLPHGEQNKSFEIYSKVAESILKKGITRNDCLIALGGGVIGDLTGFLASTLLRGVSFIQIPTTLMAMVDSSVGGKTAINTDAGKNLIGTFYQPQKVLIDVNFLTTLDKRNLKAGYTEGVKHGLITDKEYFNWCKKNGKDCLNKDLDKLIIFVSRSVEIKAKIVMEDEFESNGIRALLNLGHSFAHVYEKSTNYNPNELLHGEAVGLGIRKAFTLSKKLKMISDDQINEVFEHFSNMDLLNFPQFKKIDDNYLIENMKKDKKNTSNTYNLVLNENIGKSVFVKNVDIEMIKNLDD